MLEVDASTCEGSLNSGSTISSIHQMNQNRLAIQKISVDHLHRLERDLDLNEKVSLIFLLCGNVQQVDNLIVVQDLKVLITSEESHNLSTLLTKWYQYNGNRENWQEVLIESLLITRSNRVLRNLGLNVNLLKTTYSPHQIETANHIHPVIKALYMLAEDLDEDETVKLIDHMKSRSDDMKNFIADKAYLEIYLLYAICLNIIKIGSLDDNRSLIADTVDIKLITEFLKLNDKINWYDKLNNLPSVVTMLRHVWMDKMSSNVIETPFQEINDHHIVDNELTDDLVYKITKDNAGYILIIDQEKFFENGNIQKKHLLPKERLKDRIGTKFDCEQLKLIFSSFGYTPIVSKDRTSYDIIQDVNDIVMRSKNKNSLIVSILSHGQKGVVYGSDSIPVSIDDIERILYSKDLIHLPKLLIIQACQGTDTQEMPSSSNRLEHDGPSTVTLHSDLIRIQSTVDGFTSFRDREKGSWFIQTLCSEIDKHGDREHIQDILIRVQNIIKHRKGDNNECMVPQSKTTLSKKFFLPKRNK